MAVFIYLGKAGLVEEEVAEEVDGAPIFAVEGGRVRSGPDCLVKC